MNKYVVAGAGPVGTTVAEQLAARGDRVRLLTRSGSGPDHPLIERHRVDVARVEQLSPQLEDAAALFCCAHGSAYAAHTWRRELLPLEQTVLAAAGRTGAVAVFPESLYAFGPVEGPMTEDTPRAADAGKPAVRVELLAARSGADARTVSVMASDFFGPYVRTAHAGERMVPVVGAGKTVRVLGNPDLPHSFTYLPDLAGAMIRAADDRELWNTELMAPTGPATTQRGMAQAYAEAWGVGRAKVGRVPSWLLRGLGLVHTPSRELAEMLYQFERPFVMDSRRSEQLLGLHPTPLGAAVTATVDWWRSGAPASTAALAPGGQVV